MPCIIRALSSSVTPLANSALMREGNTLKVEADVVVLVGRPGCVGGEGGVGWVGGEGGVGGAGGDGGVGGEGGVGVVVGGKGDGEVVVTGVVVVADVVAGEGEGEGGTV